MKILIVGGYGTFGGRLAQLLADEPRVHLIIAGRSLAKAEAFCRSLPSGAGRTPAVFDREGDVEAALKALAPDIVVDATGPFQVYGEEPYRLVRAAIAAGVDYLDLADGTAFVKGIEAFDAEARERGVVVLSGVSSFPVLTAAVVRRLSQGLDRIEAIGAGIAPSPYAGVGLNVIRAISAYAGKPIAIRAEGRPAVGYGMLDARRFTIAPPGRMPLNHVLFSLVDVPDLQVLPELWPDVGSIWMGAGPVPELLHRCLNGLAWLVRIGVIPTLEPLAPLFHWAINVFRWGEHRGGMFVIVRGLAGGEAVERSWHLLAEGEDGPLIPSMAVAALVRRRLAGARPATGARPSVRELEVADYDALFETRTIHTGWRETRASDASLPLYRRVMGEAWERVAEPIRALHSLDGEMRTEGLADIDRGKGPLVWLVAAIMGFPAAGQDVSVQVAFTVEGGREHWRRTFGGRSFASMQSEGKGRSQWLVEERFGPVMIGLAPVVDGEKLRVIVRRWSLFGLPMPRFLAPYGEAFEDVDDQGRFRFDVAMTLPLIGRIVRYRGWLARAA